MSLRKMRRYIERDEWRKLSKLLDKNEDLSGGEKICKDGKTGLHLAAKLGHEDCLRVLIRGGSNVSAKDRKGNYPLYYAIKFCLKRDGFRALKAALVDPLLDRMDASLLNDENRSGTTCRHLLRGLEIKKQIAEQKPSSSDSSPLSLGGSDDSWNEKLANADYEDRIDRRLDIEDHIAKEVFTNAFHETYSQWADRIYKEFIRRKYPPKAAQSQQSSSAKKPTSHESAFKLKSEPLKLPPPPKKDSVAHKKYAELFNLSKIRARDIPFDQDTPSDAILDVILGPDASDSGKARIREAILKWHPDKFSQVFGSRVVAADREKVLSIVTRVSQALLNYGK